MSLNQPRQTMNSNRMGIHYYADTLHYREIDLQTWLPHLKQLGVGWIVLQSDLERAIPEAFVHGLVSAGINPIVRFQLSLSTPAAPETIRTLLEAYQRWGVRQIVFFDRPNARKSWPSSSWAQQDLVERFLDRFLPYANLAVDLGLTPVFPPLEPGGSFWDTAFLWTALQSLERRKEQRVIDNLVLSAYAWTHRRPLNWGAGGPQRWPDVRPYFTPPNDEDQRGFRIFEWYRSIVEAVLQRDIQVILFQAGAPGDPDQSGLCWPSDQSEVYWKIGRLLQGQPSLEGEQPICKQVMSCNFWLLAAVPGSRYSTQAWYTAPDGSTTSAQQVVDLAASENAVSGQTNHPILPTVNSHLIRHYLLLPTYEWGMADWQWNIIQPFVRKYRPTVGFSVEEAALAAEVTVIGGDDCFCDEDLNWLRQLGCVVSRLTGDGTSIATLLGER